jgi:hypothetical protein
MEPTTELQFEITSPDHYDEVVNRMIALNEELQRLTAAVIAWDDYHNPPYRLCLPPARS